MKIWYKNLDKRAKSPADGSWHQNVFDVGEVELKFEGQVTPLFQFYAELPTNGADGNTTIDEAAINLAFAKEFQVLAGEIRKSFTRAQLSSSYSYLTPQGYWLDPQKALKTIRTPWDPKKNNQDSGLMVHGDLLDGMFRYRVGVYNEHRDTGGKFWDGTGWANVGQTPNTKANDLKNFEWNARIEFTPTMLGFKPESAATITSKVADTYLGAKDVLTIGLGYHTATHTPKARILGNDVGDLKRKGWTVDAMFEKKFGNVVPNLQIGYISLDKTHFYRNFTTGTVKKGDTDVWYVTGQLLFDQCVWLGKPAIAFRYENITGDGQWTDGTILKKDLTAETFGLAFNYYIKGQAARISVGFDHTKYDDALKHYLKAGNKEDSITDWYLYLQSKF
ncbi:MAG: hypothetical protein GU354_01690 [Caldimicrobium sp.]|nr:hypothetical protein [Caldimicrobium sp.]